MGVVVVVAVVIVNFISGLLNNINNKENNSKPEKGHCDKTICVETCTYGCLYKGLFIQNATANFRRPRFSDDLATFAKENGLNITN